MALSLPEGVRAEPVCAWGSTAEPRGSQGTLAPRPPPAQSPCSELAAQGSPALFLHGHLLPQRPSWGPDGKGRMPGALQALTWQSEGGEHPDRTHPCPVTSSSPWEDQDQLSLAQRTDKVPG